MGCKALVLDVWEFLILKLRSEGVVRGSAAEALVIMLMC